MVLVIDLTTGPINFGWQFFVQARLAEPQFKLLLILWSAASNLFIFFLICGGCYQVYEWRAHLRSKGGFYCNHLIHISFGGSESKAKQR